MAVEDHYDVVVVGGGIVGLSTAMTFLRSRPGSSLLVIEKEDGLGRHQTGHNSGVIHAGVYYQPGSLKARLCAQGAQRTRQFCDEQAIPYLDTGKLIVATDDDELVRLNALHDRARSNGLPVERVDAAELRRREPHVVGVGAIHSPTTGIVDYTEICRVMAEQIVALGGQISVSTRVTGIQERHDAVTVDTASRTGVEPTDRSASVRAGRLVVCGGIQADRLARMAGLDVDFRMVPFRGEYYRLPPSKSHLVSTLIYPVPDPALPFLGVHLTMTMDGGVTVGPNAVLGWAREGYPKWSVNRSDTTDFLRYPGFWRFARTQTRTGITEQWNSLYRPGYLNLVRKYCPDLTVSDLGPEPAGIRAQAVRRDGRMVDDFLFYESPRMVHVCNAPSPAATSALPIGDLIAQKVLERAA